MRIKIITVGRLKEDFLKTGVKYYIKQILRKTQIEIVELQDEKTPDNIGEKQVNIIKDIEGEKILAKIKQGEYVIALDVNGKKLDTDDFARFIERIRESERVITFVIGGSLGLSKSVLDRSNYKLSFSDMTFPHQLMRIILLEQINKAL